MPQKPQSNCVKCGDPISIKGAVCNSCRFLKRKYGLSKRQRDQMLEDQEGQCFICLSDISFGKRGYSKGSANVDHCHTTGEVRGILCGHCNSMLGHAFDNVATLKRAIKYLEDDDVS